MTRTVVGLMLVVVTVPLAAQTPGTTAPPSYYSKTPPAGTAPNGTQPIRRTAGEAPIAGEQQPPPRTGGNVISQPPATIPNNGANPLPPTTPRPNPQPGVTQPLGPPVNPQQPRPALLPPGFPLSPAEERQIDQLLQAWQMQSGQIKHFECEFQCWEYDPTFGPKDKAKVFSKGEIKYMSPDKGLFKETESRVYSAPKEKNAEAEYNKQPPENLKHWVCDGKQIFEFDARKKEMIQRMLPPDMQGKAITDGPLPFLFGADAAKMKARYWIRPITKDGVKDAHALEAIPKTQSDAANFRMVHIVLDAKTFMPQYLELYPPNYDPVKNPARATYAFPADKVKSNFALAVAGIFTKNFYEPSLPSGWKKVVENFNGPAAGGPTGGPASGNAGAPPNRPAVAPAGATTPLGGQARGPVAPAGTTKK